MSRSETPLEARQAEDHDSIAATARSIKPEAGSEKARALGGINATISAIKTLWNVNFH